MDKRYQVFVSSTYQDLREERQEVMQALLELDCIPAGMELFQAANQDQWTLIKRVIDDCDYYLVIIGGRYGSIGPDGSSYTQMEYEYALSQKKPVIAFLHKDPGVLPVNRTEMTQEGRDKLEGFRNLAQQKMCNFWTNAADLGSVVSRNLVRLIKTDPAVGWVKADLLPDKSTTEEMLRLRQQIEELQNQLQESQQSSAQGTEHLAQGDVVELKYKFGLFRSSSWKADYIYNGTFDHSWNDIFAAVSPLLIDEASDETLKRALDQFVADKNLPKWQEHQQTKGYDIKNFVLDSDDFNTIKVQFLALRLIAKSTKRRARSVN